MNDKVKKLKALQKTVDAAAELILSASNDDLLEDIRAEGYDPMNEIQRVKDIFETSVRLKHRERLENAKAQLANKQRQNTISSTRSALPNIPNERRSLLATLLASNDLPESLTVAFRNRQESLTDEEVESILNDVADLGMLGDSKGK